MALNFIKHIEKNRYDVKIKSIVTLGDYDIVRWVLQQIKLGTGISKRNKSG